jgi:predicted DCC family thiol-disulfide oxidoreductase YuxK
MVFDGDCDFCRFWIARWKPRLGPSTDFRPFQEEAARFPEIPVEAFRRAVHLVLPDGTAYSGAEAVFRALALSAGGGAGLAAYRFLPGFAALTGALYAWIAGHRNFAAAATRALWGSEPAPPTHFRSRWLFLRALGAIFLGAFVSLRVQIDGLLGAGGIAPASDFLRAVHGQLGSAAWRYVPSLCWLASSNGALHAFCALGMVFSVLLAIDVAPSIAAFACWAIYLSLTAVGQDFLSFQWDALLIETGFLAIFLTDPRRLWKGSGRSAPPPPRIAILLFQWLLFRLLFSSGAVKLASGDRAWRDLSALDFHFETQPLPTWIGWYAHQLSGSFHHLATIVLFAIELAAPFLLFAPRRLRNGAVASFVFLQIAIGLTGNYAFFNFLTIALCLFALDDLTLRARPRPASGWPRAVLGSIAIVIAFLGAVHLAEVIFPRSRATAAVASFASPAEPFRTVNGYGLFAVMTTSRPEIIVEGSDDGATWKPYAFRWKPGNVLRRPDFVEPHQPRLDWQMWFAALSDVRQNPWFISFAHRLLEGAPDVLRLLAADPFAGRAPRFVRAELWDYRFTDGAERRRTGAWWTRTRLGAYLPAVSLEDFRKNP